MWFCMRRCRGFSAVGASLLLACVLHARVAAAMSSCEHGSTRVCSNQINVDGARAAGLTAERVVGPAQARRTLERFRLL